MYFRRYPRICLLCAIAILLIGLNIESATRVAAQQGMLVAQPVKPVAPARFSGDVRRLPAEVPYAKWDREIHPDPSLFKLAIEPADGGPVESNPALRPSAVMPSPTQNFAGLSRTDLCGMPPSAQCGAGTPPDTNGDVGIDQYIQAVNTAVGIYSKAGTLQASFTFNQLWAGAGTGTLCDTANQGDPVVLYDPMADRWIISDFAFGFSGTSTIAPYFQCFAVSQTSDPIAGGWFLYALRTDDASHVWLNDYPKFGVWPDGIYMSVNGFSNAGFFQGTEAWALNRYDMESGLPLRAFVAYIANTTDPFAMVPSNVRGNTPGSMPPAGTPNYFVSESQTAFAFEVRKFQVAANWLSASFSAATNVGQTSYTVPGQNIVPQPGTTVTLDSLGERMMQKVQYRKVSGAESLWVSHTFRSSISGPTGSQWAQINVSGGTVSTTAAQQQKFDPADTVYRWMSSIAADNAGNVALGYSASSAGVNPSIRYAGRLASDGLNSLTQTENEMQAGVGVQNGNCGSSACHRWGDYSAMSVDPADDCTFWFTSEYYAAAGVSTIAWNTRIGAFRFSPAQCVSTPVTLTNHSLIFDGGVGSDWSPVSERLGTSGTAPHTFDYFLTWDNTNLYAGMKGLSNTLPYTFALVIDTDPATQSPANTGSAVALACAGGFSANAKGNFALVRPSANPTAGTSKFQASGGAWAAWAPGSSDALDFGRNMVEFRLNWGDVGLSAPAGTAGIYLFVCQDKTLVSSWPPEDLQSGSPVLNVETTVPLNDTGRTPRTYSPHAGQETAALTNSAGPFNLLNGYVQLANISGLSGVCSFAAVDGGNLSGAPAALMARRTYTLSPGAGCTGLTADVTLKYEDGTTANHAPSEINGLTEASLTLFRNDAGSWVDQGGTVNMATNTVTRLAVNSFSQWGFGTSHPTAVNVTKVSAEGEIGYGVWLMLGAAALGAIALAGLTRRPAST